MDSLSYSCAPSRTTFRLDDQETVLGASYPLALSRVTPLIRKPTICVQSSLPVAISRYTEYERGISLVPSNTARVAWPIRYHLLTWREYIGTKVFRLGVQFDLKRSAWREIQVHPRQGAYANAPVSGSRNNGPIYGPAPRRKGGWFPEPHYLRSEQTMLHIAAHRYHPCRQNDGPET